MPRLPVITGKRLLAALQKHGFRLLRQKGSHVFVESPDGTKGSAIPIHRGEDLGRGLLKSILNDLAIDVDDLAQMLRK